MKRLIMCMIESVKGLLKQGMSPNTLAITLAAGAIIGVFPVFGITTALSIVVATAFRLNQVAIQLANYCVYPLQFVLFIPFVRLGESLFGLEPVSINPVDIFDLARSDFYLFMDLYGIAILTACVAWVLAAIPASLVLWKLLSLVLKRFSRTKSIRS